MQKEVTKGWSGYVKSSGVSVLSPARLVRDNQGRFMHHVKEDKINNTERNNGLGQADELCDANNNISHMRESGRKNPKCSASLFFHIECLRRHLLESVVVILQQMANLVTPRT